ncbi:hypothetical protein V6Z11_A11G182000 [Gossypium hirsutum]
MNRFKRKKGEIGGCNLDVGGAVLQASVDGTRRQQLNC